MIGDFALEIVVSPVGATISLPNAAPAGRLTWASRITTAQPVFYILDSTTAQEWGVGAYDPVAHTIIRPTVVMGNSAGTTAQLSQAAFGGAGSSCRCYGGVPSAAMIGQVWGGNVGRNLLHNGIFGFQQRASPVTAANVYLPCDRWANAAQNGTRSVSIVNLNDTDRSQIGNEHAYTAMQYVFSGGGTAGDFELLYQRGELLRAVCGKTVTLSFWAKAATGNPKIGINLTRNFGGGGSTADRALTTGPTVTLSTTWTRYAVTFAVLSASGKTFGTSDNWQIELFLSATGSFAIAGNIGQQAATISFFGAQLEVGSAPSPFERIDPALLAAQCYRFYQTGGFATNGYAGGGNGILVLQPFFIPMRALPVITVSGVTTINITGASVTANGGQGLFLQGTGTATGGYIFQGSFTASADL